MTEKPGKSGSLGEREDQVQVMDDDAVASELPRLKATLLAE